MHFMKNTIQKGVIIMNNNELCHFGVKGMKWGVRKQRTSLGTKLRMRSQAKKKSYSDDSNSAHDKRSIKQLSTAELKQRTERIKAEKAYKDAVKGNSWVRGFAQKQFDRQIDRIVQPQIDRGVDYVKNKASGAVRSRLSGRRGS